MQKKLAEDLNITNVDFIESDIMKFMDQHKEKYDVVFVSEGAIGWLPDLKKNGERPYVIYSRMMDFSMFLTAIRFFSGNG